MNNALNEKVVDAIAGWHARDVDGGHVDGGHDASRAWRAARAAGGVNGDAVDDDGVGRLMTYYARTRTRTRPSSPHEPPRARTMYARASQAAHPHSRPHLAEQVRGRLHASCVGRAAVEESRHWRQFRVRVRLFHRQDIR